MQSRIFFVFVLFCLSSADISCVDGICAADTGTAGMSLLQNRAAKDALQKGDVKDEDASDEDDEDDGEDDGEDDEGDDDAEDDEDDDEDDAESNANSTKADGKFDLPDLGDPPADDQSSTEASFVEYDDKDDEGDDAKADEDDAEDDAEAGATGRHGKGKLGRHGKGTKAAISDEEFEISDIGDPPANDPEFAEDENTDEPSESIIKPDGGAQ